MAQALHFTLGQNQLHPAFASLEAKLKIMKEKGNILLKFANALWPQVGYSFLEEFLSLIEEYYGVSITPVDYSDPETARRKINAWVEEKTQEMIKELIPPGLLDPLTSLVLINAVYFKGNWANQFNQSLTRDAPFLVTHDEQIQVPMMTQKHEFGYGESAGLQVLELPYSGDNLSMTVLLPTETDGLAKLEESLTAGNLGKWIRNLREIEVVVFLPRFEVTFPFRLDDILKSMGMVDAFSNKADFSGMDKKSLIISAVLHKAFVTVNEEGTEAIAATAVLMGRGLPSPPLIFRADHPFVFLIREKTTGSILFLGRVVDPT